MKLAFKIIGAFVLAILLFIGGLNLLARHIFNRQDCTLFNIDNIETRTRINIPSIADHTCTCKNGIKDATFILDLDKDEIEPYISKNEFKPEGSLFIQGYENEYTNWTAELDTSNLKLSFHIEYKK